MEIFYSSTLDTLYQETQNSPFAAMSRAGRPSHGHLRLEVHRHDALDAQGRRGRLELLVRGAHVVVVLHVLHAGELGLGNQRVALRARVLLGLAHHQREDVRLAVLWDVGGRGSAVHLERQRKQKKDAEWRETLWGRSCWSWGIRRFCPSYLLLVGAEHLVVLKQTLPALGAGQLEHGDPVDPVRHRAVSSRSRGRWYWSKRGRAPATRNLGRGAEEERQSAESPVCLLWRCPARLALERGGNERHVSSQKTRQDLLA